MSRFHRTKIHTLLETPENALRTLIPSGQNTPPPDLTMSKVWKFFLFMASLIYIYKQDQIFSMAEN